MYHCFVLSIYLFFLNLSFEQRSSWNMASKLSWSYPVIYIFRVPKKIITFTTTFHSRKEKFGKKRGKILAWKRRAIYQPCFYQPASVSLFGQDLFEVWLSTRLNNLSEYQKTRGSSFSSKRWLRREESVARDPHLVSGMS